MPNLEPCSTHDDLVPGTVYLVQQEQQCINSKHDIVLVPAPSTDPSDPLVSLRSGEWYPNTDHGSAGPNGASPTTSFSCCECDLLMNFDSDADDFIVRTVLSWELSPIGKLRYMFSS